MTILPDTHPNLRTVCTPVAEVTPHLRMLAVSMLAAFPPDGVGLAANQVGETCRLIVINYKETKLIMFNPEILDIRGNIITMTEGCLSSRGKWPFVGRYQAIRASWINEYGQPQRRMFTGYIARIVQHEVAHLDGILMTDANVHCHNVTGLSLS